MSNEHKNVLLIVVFYRIFSTKPVADHRPRPVVPGTAVADDQPPVPGAAKNTHLKFLCE